VTPYNVLYNGNDGFSDILNKGDIIAIFERVGDKVLNLKSNKGRLANFIL
jgi:hypothetical protein